MAYLNFSSNDRGDVQARSAPGIESINSLDRPPNRFHPNCLTFVLIPQERLRAVGRIDTPGLFGLFLRSYG
jgi:hypothetical protein